MNVIKYARRRKYWTQKQLAEQMNVNIQTISYWENRQLPPYPILRHISLILGYRFPNTPLIAQTISQKIQLVRYENKLSQTEFANLLKTNKTTIINWETGKNIPNHHHRKQLIKKFNLSPIEINFQIETSKKNLNRKV